MNRRNWYLIMNGLIGLWLVAAAVVVVAHQILPAGGWLMVHLLLLGAVSTAILVWSQHFADTLLRRPAKGGRAFHAARLATHTFGAAAVIAGVAAGVSVLTVGGGVLVGATAIAHAGSLIAQVRGALPARFAPLVRYYIAASLALVIGVALGVMLALGWLPTGWAGRAVVAHIGANLLGWIGLTVIGTIVLLWPTVLRTRATPRADAAARHALPLLIAGVTLAVLGSLGDWRPVIVAGLLAYLVGLGLVVAEGVRQARAAPPATFAAWSIAAAVGWLTVCVVALGVIVVAPGDVGGGLGWLVPPFAVGFAGQVLLGALSHLLPVVLGGGPAGGRAASTELDRASLFRVLIVNTGIVLYLLPVPSLVKVTISLVVFAALVVFPVLAVRAVIAARRIGAGDQAPPIGRARPASLIGAVVAAAGALLLATAAGVALDPAAAGLATVTAGPAVVETGNTTTVNVTMKDMRYTPDRIEVPTGDRLVITLVNDDDQIHDLVFENGVTSPRVPAGGTVTIDAGVIAADLDGWCSVAGHRQMGMVLTIVAIGAADGDGGSAGTGDDPHEHGQTDGPSATERLDLMARPEAGFRARNAAVPSSPSTTMHEVTLTVEEIEHEVAPGVSQTLWTFNGTAPGPTLRGKVGDVFTITLINDGSLGHSIDFHAGALAPDEPMRTIDPGASLTFSFTATRSGIWMYHCATVPMSLHVANGMFGAVIIDPPALADVDREYLLVQSELYLGAQGEVADATKVNEKNADLVVFNGYANQYRHQPLAARVGESVRVWVLDAGPNLSTSFHIIGGQFHTVFAEGDYRLNNGGSTGTGGSQTLGLFPAQGGFVELVFPEAGNYPFVSHIMSDAERGAAGLFRITP